MPARVEAKASVENPSLDQKRGSNNAFVSIEVHVREETSADMSIRAVMEEMKQLRGTTRTGHKPKLSLRLHLVEESLHLCSFNQKHGIALSAAQDNDQYYAWSTQVLMQSLFRCVLEYKERLQSVKSQVPQSLVLLFKSISTAVQRDWLLLCQTQPS